MYVMRIQDPVGLEWDQKKIVGIRRVQNSSEEQQDQCDSCEHCGP